MVEAHFFDFPEPRLTDLFLDGKSLDFYLQIITILIQPNLDWGASRDSQPNNCNWMFTSLECLSRLAKVEELGSFDLYNY